MADATAITAIVMAGAAAVGSATPYVMSRRKQARQRDSASVASWSGLNDALQREIGRMHDEQDRLRAEYASQISGMKRDYQDQLDAMKRDYEGQISAARKRITELESEVAALQRALRSP